MSPRRTNLAAAGHGRGLDPRLDLRRAGRLRRPGRGGAGLHRRLGTHAPPGRGRGWTGCSRRASIEVDRAPWWRQPPFPLA